MAKVVIRKETGKLVIDFTFRGVRCREQTALSDTVANRRRLEAVVKKIKQAQADGTFNYRDYFPGSPLAARFDIPKAEQAAALSTFGSTLEPPRAPTPLFRDFTTQWLAEHEIQWRRSHIVVLRVTIDKYLPSSTPTAVSA